MRWRLILKEFGPEPKYIKGENNVVSNNLYRLEISDNQEILNISELYGYDDVVFSFDIFQFRAKLVWLLGTSALRVLH